MKKRRRKNSNRGPIYVEIYRLSCMWTSKTHSPIKIHKNGREKKYPHSQSKLKAKLYLSLILMLFSISSCSFRHLVSFGRWKGSALLLRTTHRPHRKSIRTVPWGSSSINEGDPSAPVSLGKFSFSFLKKFNLTIASLCSGRWITMLQESS